MGPFHSLRENKNILVLADYVSKGVKFVANPTNDTRVVTKFLKRVIFPQFDVLRVLN